MRLSQLTSAIAMALSIAQLSPLDKAMRAAVRYNSRTLRRTPVKKANGQRESLRAFRRAQGGPGIELTAGVWHPRNPAGLQGDGQ